MPAFDDIGIVFDATSAGAHTRARRRAARAHGKRIIDLTPAAIGPYVVPPVNLRRASRRAERQHGDLRRAGDDPDRRRGRSRRAGALCRDRRVDRVASRPARARARTSTSSPRPPRGPSRQSAARERGKAIIILNPAEPPLIMRDTVYACRATPTSEQIARVGRARWSPRCRPTCPGYRLKQHVQFERIGASDRCAFPGSDASSRGLKMSVFLEVEGAAHYLPAYAGNLDIMTSAALRTAERIARAHAARSPHERRPKRTEALHPGRHAARRHARHPPPVRHRPRARDRRGARRGRRRRDRGRARRRARRLAASTTASARTPTGNGSRPSPTCSKHAKLTTLLLPGIGTVHDLKRAYDARRALGARRDPLHRGRHLEAAHRDGARARHGRRRLPDDEPHDRRRRSSPSRRS